jgi:Septum formation
MSHHRSIAAGRLATAGVLVTVVALLAGCSGGTHSPAKRSDPPKRSTSASASADAAAAPKVDECRTYSYKVYGATSDDSPAVACTGRHTAWTYRVGTLPAKLLARATATKDEALSDYASTACDSGFDARIGATDAQSRATILDEAFFIPTPAQRKAGAAWFRCDVVALVGPTLVPLPAGTGPYLSGRTVPDRLALCAQRDNTMVVCTLPHNLRLRGSFHVNGKRSAYPGRPALLRMANGKCYTIIQKATGVNVGTRLSYFMQTPSKKQWRGGLQAVYCYQRIRS